MIAADTNVLIYYMLDQPQGSNTSVKKIIRETKEKLTELFDKKERIALPMPVLIEFANFAKRRTSKETCNQIIDSLIADKNFELLPVSQKSAEDAMNLANRTGTDFSDALICITMQESGIKSIFTWDSDFEKFKEIEIIR
ncbi:MAG: type II toxin-antitoxin system VapC family toxin [Candidatus Micrarchaeota archaeon]